MTCKNLSLPSCSSSSGSLRILPHPPSNCNIQHEIAPPHSEYNGPFINSSQTIMPSSLIHHKHTRINFSSLRHFRVY